MDQSPSDPSTVADESKQRQKMQQQQSRGIRTETEREPTTDAIPPGDAENGKQKKTQAKAGRWLADRRAAENHGSLVAKSERRLELRGDDHYPEKVEVVDSRYIRLINPHCHADHPEQVGEAISCSP